jgi:hypothetical protein
VTDLSCILVVVVITLLTVIELYSTVNFMFNNSKNRIL